MPNKQLLPAHSGVQPYPVAILLAGIAVLCLARLVSYLLFHTVVEIFTVTVAWSIFVLAWHARRYLENDYLLFAGIASLFVGVLDLLHALAYKGMGVFESGGTDLPTQLWIAGRHLQSVSLVLAPLFLRRHLNHRLAVAGFAAGAVALAGSIAAGVFPHCYIEGVGLTAFKIGSEYVVILLLSVSGVLLYRNRDSFEPSVFRLIAASIALMVLAEASFTLYTDVYGALNMIGHLLRFCAFGLLYRAILVTGVVRPHAILFRDLVRSQEELRKEAVERDRLITELQQALAHVQQLSGLLPICAQCKKVRDDRGYWKQVESYIAERTSVSFSHGICPDCAHVLYPELFPER